MKLKSKIRLLVVMTIVALLIGGFVTGKILIIPTHTVSPSAAFNVSIHELELMGGSPQEKITRLSSIIEGRYPEAAIAGQYGINPMTGTDFVQYEVILHFIRPNGPIAYAQVTELKNRILGELSLGTAKLLSAETQIPTIGRNSLNDMVITVTTIYVERTDASNYEMNPENKVGEFFNPEPFLQQAAEKVAYLFDEARIIQLMKEKDVLKWSKYAVPKPHVPAIPNTGPIEKPKPPIPDK